MKRLMTNVLLLTGTVAMLLLLAELATRIIMPTSVKIRLMHQPDKKLGYRLAPNYSTDYRTADFQTAIRISAQGLRDREYPAAKEPGVVRILVLGDSFTFGVGVNAEETYAKVLESLLNGAGGRNRYEVVNAGVEGYGTEQEFVYFQELQQRFRPDLVIVGLHSNDVNDVLQGIPVASMKQQLKKRFYFLSYLRGVQLLLVEIFGKDRTFQRLFEIYREQRTPQFDAALRRTEQYLDDIRNAAGEAGARTMVVIIPSCFELDKAEWDRKGFQRFYTDEFFRANMTRFSDTFAEYGKLRRIPTLPLLPALRASTVRPLYFTRDPHWTPAGHRLAAESILAFIRQERLIPE